METNAERFEKKLGSELLQVTYLTAYLTWTGLLVIIIKPSFALTVGIAYLVLVAIVNAFVLFWVRRERKLAESLDITQHRWTHPEQR